MQTVQMAANVVIVQMIQTLMVSIKIVMAQMETAFAVHVSAVKGRYW